MLGFVEIDVVEFDVVEFDVVVVENVEFVGLKVDVVGRLI